MTNWMRLWQAAIPQRPMVCPEQSLQMTAKLSLRWKMHLKEQPENFYINDKPTGAVIGQQPFGGARASGTNDKAGSEINMYRWLSPRTIKELRVPCLDVTYPYMVEA